MMGKKNGNSWLNSVKKAFKSSSKDNEKMNNKRREQNQQEEEEEEEKKRGKRKWIFGKHFPIETTIHHKVAKTAISLCSSTKQNINMVAKDDQPKLIMEKENYTQKRALAVAMASVTTAAAAVVIQTFFRGYLARRALLALKGVVKMQALIRGHNVRKRAKMTLQCIQSLVRVQALVCDQRKRLLCDHAVLGHTSNNNTSNNLDLEEIQALIEKAKQCSLKQGSTLAHILSHQTWTLDGDQDLEKQQHKYCRGRKLTIHPTVRKDRNLCIDQRGPIKTVEIDTSRPYSFTSPKSFTRSQNQDSYFNPSPKTTSLSTMSYQIAETTTPTSRAIYLHQMSLSENSCPFPRPNYMAVTQSAMARVRSHSTPRHRSYSSPSRQQMGSAKKRLSFPIPDEERSHVPYYLTE